MTTTSASPTPGRRGPKTMLTQAAVLEAALDLVDTDGLSALSLRGLATRLGVSAMTPYRYFGDKAELLTAMVGYALAPLAAPPSADDPWDSRIEAAMRGLHDALERHPGVVELIIAESDGNRLDEFRQQLITILREAGLPRARATDVLRTLTSYTLGYTMLDRLRPGRRGTRPRAGGSFDDGSFDDGLAMIMDSQRRELAPT